MELRNPRRWRVYRQAIPTGLAFWQYLRVGDRCLYGIGDWSSLGIGDWQYLRGWRPPVPAGF